MNIPEPKTDTPQMAPKTKWQLSEKQLGTILIKFQELVETIYMNKKLRWHLQKNKGTCTRAQMLCPFCQNWLHIR
jgi:hypothetical protein